MLRSVPRGGWASPRAVGCFHLSAGVNQAAVDVGVQVSLQIPAFLGCPGQRCWARVNLHRALRNCRSTPFTLLADSPGLAVPGPACPAVGCVEWLPCWWLHLHPLGLCPSCRVLEAGSRTGEKPVLFAHWGPQGRTAAPGGWGVCPGHARWLPTQASGLPINRPAVGPQTMVRLFGQPGRPARGLGAAIKAP